ncbi:Cytochrome c1 heme lyase [Serendipita sp. 405]|nr:Cytochrome c1 heme lyase [Serendipita sp. 397]KAG8771136.1 Cytochrome c1 heme lyase [Serendipita sp. 398]KAG8841982.1 Cytochrome c1 heme lyase [Serendipita sp. 405]
MGANTSSPQATPTDPQQSTSTTKSEDKCPVDHNARQAWGNIPSDHFHHHVKPSRGSNSLSTEREVSSIPRGGLSDSTDGQEKDEKWVYPSEAQFYAALLRKHQSSASPDVGSSSSHGEEVDKVEKRARGDIEVDASGAAVTNSHAVKLPQARDMHVVVPIHNAVNEQTWAKVLQWEADRGGQQCGGIRLVSFKGDSRNISPKARWRILLGYQRPFDRHDWVIDRCGTRVRYVIDYYTGRTTGPNASPFSFYIDARPALDSWEGIQMRGLHLWRSIFDQKEKKDS